MPPLDWPFKDPDEVLDYEIDWSDRLDGDTISSSDWEIEAGITEGSTSNTTTVTKIWLSGGTIGEKYVLTNRIVTAGGRTMDQSTRIAVKAK
jgi:hypothetical protein